MHATLGSCFVRHYVFPAALDAPIPASQVALLEPLAAQLGLELSISVFACTDDKFMGLFTGVLGTAYDHRTRQPEASGKWCST